MRQLAPLHARERGELGEQLRHVGALAGEHAAHRPLVAEAAHQGAGVDAVEGGQAVAAQVLDEALAGAVRGGHRGGAGHRQPLHPRVRRLFVAGATP